VKFLVRGSPPTVLKAPLEGERRDQGRRGAQHRSAMVVPEVGAASSRGLPAASAPLSKALSAPVSLGGLFDDGEDHAEEEREASGFNNTAQVASVELGGMRLSIAERPFHALNANAVWPGTHVLAEWVLANREALAGRRIIELGSATGALSIFCTKLGLGPLVTSDVDDGEVEQAVAANFRLNGLEPPPHAAHTWGTPLPPVACAPFDYVIASDILLVSFEASALLARRSFPNFALIVWVCCAVLCCTLALQYVKSYPALVKTLAFLCAPRGKSSPGAAFVMSWQRRMKDSEDFFAQAAARGFSCEHLGRRVYEMRLSSTPGVGP
jgi:hypothetical protein